jgi:hypothetical protein
VLVRLARAGLSNRARARSEPTEQCVSSSKGVRVEETAAKSLSYSSEATRRCCHAVGRTLISSLEPRMG